MDRLSPFYFPYATDQFEEWAPRTMLGIMGIMPQTVKPDIIYSNIKLPPKHITIIGGGPSTLTLDSLPTNIWTMNGFYKKFDVGCDLISIGGSVDINDVKLKQYIDKYKPQVVFEIHPNWYKRKLPATGFYHTKMYGQIGVGVRLINLAAAIGAEQIDFIGLDGPQAILNGEHSFEPGKTELPSLCTPQNAHQIHIDQYQFFWKYIKELYPHIRINSLDKNNIYHKELEI